MSAPEGYSDVIAALMADPIIQAMASEIEGVEADLKSFTFIGAAHREYRRRGGQEPTHVGGPAEAIRRLRRWQ